MQRGTQLCVACVLLLVYQCAAQGGGGGHGKTTTATYAHSRDFSQWTRGLHQDPLVLVAFITAVISGNQTNDAAIELLLAVAYSQQFSTPSTYLSALSNSRLQFLDFCSSCGLWCMTTCMQQQSASGYAAKGH